ncbi:eukaryotic translation initiation factor 3 subunit J-like isoform X2 [Varroa jacobsoni]|uniref:Eukaryotic translation initiation factor 3 subunit J n=1 Tax=Varroa destructor TaxID=109461 RepID=A0A7M7MAW9_VARDE|nr:eukaryotic translation initiation factor 3 subunit J-like isoform X2 [Varroa destructor]XP_022687842.1 eukaryotic translation initiation factor 3 subunit J-like isoform X2 [Varroa jacobsoni]
MAENGEPTCERALTFWPALMLLNINHDSKDFKPPVLMDRWEGEDEDDVKDNWDDEDEEVEKLQIGVPAPQPRKRKTFQQIVAEKEEKQRREAEERRRRKAEEEKNAGPEEQNAEKLRRQKLQEEADLRAAMETFGISTQGTIDSITPVEREDYENLRKLLVAKLTPNEKSPLYIPFLDDLLRDLTANLEADDIKKLSSSLNTLANEKIKMAKGTKGKKKKGASLKMERGELDAYTGGDDICEYDDFM